MLQTIESIGQFTYFSVRGLGYGLGTILRPGLLLPQLYSMLIGAFPLAVVAGIALGAVVWMHLYSALVRSGTQEALPTFLSAAVLLELAPIGAGLILGARTGAAIGAELGAMKQNEQIDAMEMLGVRPFRVLVGPRVLACMLALPIVNVLIALLALLSGYVVETMVSHSSWERYQALCVRELELGEVTYAGFKTIVFGFLVAISGCYHGFQAEGGTEGVGQAATRSVVAACLFVLVADVILVAIIRLA